MNTFLHPDGGGYAWPLRLVCRRWGGGAHPGKTHVYTLLSWGENQLGSVSMQCVTDDFGDLVEVPA